jgi:hypothetical protein
MAETEIPAAAGLLLRERVHSFEQLEALACVFRERSRWWSADAVAAATRISVESATDGLQALLARALVQATRDASALRFRYAPSSAEIDAAVAELVRTYDDNRIAVVKRMSDNAIERMRTGAMRAFSDAFVIRRRDRDG